MTYEKQSTEQRNIDFEGGIDQADLTLITTQSGNLAGTFVDESGFHFSFQFAS